MAFTYDLTTDRGVVRFNLGDTQVNIGPRPDKRNYSDEEIDFLITIEPAGNTAATARGFDTLASEWTSYSLEEREGEADFDANEVAGNYLDIAKEWRAKPDGGDSSGSLKSGLLIYDFAEKGDDTSS